VTKHASQSPGNPGLARAHARSGDRIAIAAHLGRSAVFDQAIAEFAASCADQNELDYPWPLPAKPDA
jgi:thiamine monophosphate kinase